MRRSSYQAWAVNRIHTDEVVPELEDKDQAATAVRDDEYALAHCAFGVIESVDSSVDGAAKGFVRSCSLGVFVGRRCGDVCRERCL